MKEYNWREERKKYQADFRKQEETIPQQPAEPAAPQVKPVNKTGIYILAAVVVVVVAAFIFLRPGKSETRKTESITIDQDTNTVTIRQNTHTTVQPANNGLNIQVPTLSSSEKQSFESIAEAKKHAVGAVTIYWEIDDVLQARIPIGSAWAFSPRQFATNAHVANGIFEVRNNKIAEYAIKLAVNELKAQNVTDIIKRYGHAKAIDIFSSYIPEAIRRSSFSVRIPINQQSMKSCQVVDVQIHPDYKEIYSPDVAVITVREPHNHYFKLASKEKLYNLKSGRPIAFLGFPMDNLYKNNLDIDSPVATLQSGSIIAVSGFDLKQTLPQNAFWIRHNLPSTGGASGSVIFDKDGEVIALHNSGHINPDGRPNAVQVNGAIRVDLLEGVGRKVPIENWLKRGISPRKLIEDVINSIKI